METKRKICRNCPAVLPEGSEGIRVPSHRYRGQQIYQQVCLECSRIFRIIEERKEAVRKERQRNLRMKRRKRG